MIIFSYYYNIVIIVAFAWKTSNCVVFQVRPILKTVDVSNIVENAGILTQKSKHTSDHDFGGPEIKLMKTKLEVRRCDICAIDFHFFPYKGYRDLSSLVIKVKSAVRCRKRAQVEL